ncbi:hypothetical protein LLG90_03275 [Aromatoleum toluclasticum]|uniref:hypothetical protein n=1 Tax=Aromatoleum toluclasticum TaxID=92003 RepID=UPI001D1865F7|nr:hypothetical protein [Aromatoleum toluclasticum]MCC4114368.1 hypothetical protein [Aromatoleum toluclasticum]
MAMNIRTLVALGAVPFLLSAGAANAAKPNTEPPGQYDLYAYESGCEDHFAGLDAVLRGMYGATPSDKQRSVIDGLVSKDYGADQKTDQGKYPEALGLLGQIEDKALYLYSLTGKSMEISAATYEAIMAYVSAEPMLDGTLKGTASNCVQSLQ